VTGKLIQQQMYTRERGGIFHTTDGYDTIAISEGLEHAFVKKYLHPFCMYHAPKALTERGEKDASLFPKAVTIFQPETGHLVIGQAVFVPADFTGQRSTYFMHNYIVPPSRKDEWIKNPEKLFQWKGFANSYDIMDGKIIPECDHMESGEKDILLDKEVLLKKLGLREDQFKQLLYAIMTSIAGKKKVFISLNVPLKDYSTYALELLELISVYLPYAHRRKLGAITFTSSPETKNYIHVVFYEPGTLNIADRSIEKQLIFDLSARRISGVEIEGQKHEYLDFAMKHFSESKRIEDFFDFAENALYGLGEDQKLEVASYYQLTAIYLTLNDQNGTLYHNNKIGFLHSLLKFLRVNSEVKPALAELFHKLVTEEKVPADKNTVLDYIQAVVAINSIVRSDEALGLIVDTIAFYQKDPLFQMLWKVIEQDKLGYQAILMFMNDHPDYELLLEQYLDDRLVQVVHTEDVLKELHLMLVTPFLLDVEKFKAVAIRKVVSSITHASNPFHSVLLVKNFSMEQPSAAFIEFKDELLAHAKLALLRSIRVKELTMNDVLMFGKIYPNEHNVRDIKDVKVKENYQITNALYQLISIPSQAGTYDLRPLTGTIRAHIRSTLQQLLRNKPTAEHFPLLFVAFDTEYDGVDYQGLLDYLIRYGEDQTLLSFIRGNVRKIETDVHYRRSLRKYLISHPQSIWKNSSFRKELLLIKNYSFKNLLKEVQIETASPLVKFLKKYGLKLGLSLVILGGASGGAWYGYSKLFADDPKPKAKVEKTTGTVTAVKKETAVPKKPADISLNEFKEASQGEVAGQTFVLNLGGKQLSTITGQDQVVTMTNIDGEAYQLFFNTKPATDPVDLNKLLKNGYSLSGIEYDFDPSDENVEVVLVTQNHAADTSVWIYSINKKGLKGILSPVLKESGFSNVRLNEKTLVLTRDKKEVNYTYSADLNSFIVQQ
jgi:hypothetical protein